jgi:pyridoxamine 5'-phosphate oxidase
LSAAVDARFGDGPITTPANWGGYLLRPDAVEFWQGRPGRLHDRIRFRLDDGTWVRERLAP